MKREEAIKEMREKLPWLTEDTKRLVEALIPELVESEDERIRKELVAFFKEMRDTWHEIYWHDLQVEGILAWLEKQKENPKSADSIPSNCVSDAKCEDRWHKVGDSLPDNPREVLCKDAAGNYFIGRYYSDEGWEISNYDDEDKPHHLNPPVSKWIDFPLEKQKEQEWSEEDENIYESIQTILLAEARFVEERKWFDSIKARIKSVCWDEKDEKMRDRLIDRLQFITLNTRTDTTSPNITFFDEIEWLKSLRPQPKQEWSKEDENIYNKALDAIYYKDLNDKDEVVDALKALCDLISRKRKVIPPYAHWKPSEEQMKWLRDVIETVPMTCRQQIPLESLYNDLRRLM